MTANQAPPKCPAIITTNNEKNDTPDCAEPGRADKRPPLGVMPRWLWCEHRIIELSRAMLRAHDSPHTQTDVLTVAKFAREVRDVLNFAEEKL